MGIGLGLASVFYFLNIVANISDKVDFLRYITPFAYAEGTDIVTSGKLETGILALGLVYGGAGILTAYWQYNRKDIH